jgi:hypothetical protein
VPHQPCHISLPEKKLLLFIFSSHKKMVCDVTVALDWTLNTNHTGFIVGQRLGFYAEEGIHQCKLVEPGPSYTPPAELVRNGAALFAVTPSESVISSHTQGRTPPLQVHADDRVPSVLQTGLNGMQCAIEEFPLSCRPWHLSCSKIVQPSPR